MCILIYEISTDTFILSRFKWLLQIQGNGKFGLLHLTLILEYINILTLDICEVQ